MRVQSGSDYPSTTQVVSHVIVSRGSGQLYLSSLPPNRGIRHKAFLSWVRRSATAHTRSAFCKNTSGPKDGHLRRQASSLTSPKRVKPWVAAYWGQRDLHCRDTHDRAAHLTIRPAEGRPNNWRGVPNTGVWLTPFDAALTSIYGGERVFI